MGLAYPGCMPPLSLPAVVERIRTVGDAYELLEEMRWAGQPVCPHCASARPHYFLTPRAEAGRASRRGKATDKSLLPGRNFVPVLRKFTVEVYPSLELAYRAGNSDDAEHWSEFEHGGPALSVMLAPLLGGVALKFDGGGAEPVAASVVISNCPFR